MVGGSLGGAADRQQIDHDVLGVAVAGIRDRQLIDLGIAEVDFGRTREAHDQFRFLHFDQGLRNLWRADALHRQIDGNVCE